jgi:hypothetical protein
MKNFAFFTMLLLAFTFAFTACNKDDTDENTTTDENVLTSEDLTAAEDLLLDLEDEVDEIIENQLTGDVEIRNECPVKTVSPAGNTFPKTITLDYGTGCTARNGRLKSGKVIITQNATPTQTGATRTITLENYYVDSAKVEGTTTLVNNGNASRSRQSNVKITYPNGEVANWQGQHTYIQTAGANTPRIFDDVFQITGSSSGTNREGKSYSASILEPLVKAVSCRWIKNGIRQVKRGDNTTTIDYGFGDNCDNKAQVTLPSGETRVIRIEAWWRR